MPNQVNYPDPIPVPYIAVRPERLAQQDRNLIQSGTKQILFGTDSRDYVELWVYDSNGSIAGHVNLPVTDPSLTLSTIIDNTGSYEMLNIDMGKAVRLMLVESGRYGFVANFFRNEVGSEEGDKLYIVDISDDRTELRLSPTHVTEQILREIYEWAVPSVPKLAAQGLINQTFGQSLDFTQSEILTPVKIMTELDNFINNTSSKVNFSGTIQEYNELVSTIIDATGKLTIEKMAADTSNRNIQEADLELYISEAVGEVIQLLRDSGIIDPRFEAF